MRPQCNVLFDFVRSCNFYAVTMTFNVPSKSNALSITHNRLKQNQLEFNASVSLNGFVLVLLRWADGRISYQKTHTHTLRFYFFFLEVRTKVHLNGHLKLFTEYYRGCLNLMRVESKRMKMKAELSKQTIYKKEIRRDSSNRQQRNELKRRVKNYPLK